MPLVIGEINARIEVDETSAERPAMPSANAAPSLLDDEASRARALAAARFDAERRIDQRDPDLLGGG